jgi:hypothetical protein
MDLTVETEGNALVHFAKLSYSSRIGLSEQLWVLEDIGSEVGDLVLELSGDSVVNESREENDGEANDAHENHLVGFSLANALLPNVELDTRLLFKTPSTHGVDVVHKALKDALGREGGHGGKGVVDRRKVEWVGIH